MSRVLLSCLALVLLVPFCRAQSVASKLPNLVSYSLDPGGKEELDDVLDQLRNRFELTIEYNEAALRGEAECGDPEKIIKAVVGGRGFNLHSRSLEDVLKKVLSQVQTPSGLTFLVRERYIEITTGKAARDEVWGPDAKGPFLPLVHADFEKTPLADACDHLARSSGYSIVLDPEIKDAKKPLTLKLRNTPVDVATRTIADMAKLDMERRGNLFYLKARTAGQASEEGTRDRPAGGRPATPDK